ncbi:MAG TPA: hypothetical protein VK590_07625 [Saprospiraceae bacterium]|nr:hypothetical protein [Saprospiraceae bacterium]
MIKLEIVLEEEQIKEAFENCEIKFSKAKLKKLKEAVDFQDIDIKEILENALLEQLEEMIEEQFGE